jgi:peptidoglycan/xylan/chitin deacetylase (PgdA/CDA1 family)
MKLLHKQFCLIAILLIIAVSPAISASYLELINSGVTKVEAGDYDGAVSDVNLAFTQDNVDPLAHYLMAVIYMHTNDFVNAEIEINKALTSRPDEWRGHYALGVLDLNSGKYSDASAHFSTAMKNPNAEAYIMPLVNYYNHLSDKPMAENSTPINSALDIQVYAMDAIKAGNDELGMKYLQLVDQFEKALGCYENRSPIVSFDSAKPLLFPSAKLKWKPTIPKGAAVVSGVVNLQGNAKAESGIEFVSVYIDDVFAGVTNSQPYEFDWDTTKYVNGLHQVKMEGKNASGMVINSKIIWANVKNEKPYIPPVKEGKTVDELMKRIWKHIAISDSKVILHYHLAMLYIKFNDNSNAIRELEFVQGYNPGYKDSLELLRNLKGRKFNYQEVYSGPSKHKKIALTFDDGPNERTQEMLDVLSKLNVKATFFIVGYVAETQKDMVQKMFDLGHQIENHSYSHRRFSTLTEKEIELEIAKGAAIIKSITGRTAMYFRPPGGHANNAMKTAAKRQGLNSVFWSILCSPYEGENYGDLAEHVLKNAANGSVILMHNGEPAATSALLTIVPKLRAKGFEFVTLDELLAPTNQAASSESKRKPNKIEN